MRKEYHVELAVLAAAVILCPMSAPAQGGVPLWTNRYDAVGGSSDLANAIAVDNGGNVIVTGASGGGSEFKTIKYSGAGVPLWTNQYNEGFGFYENFTSAVAVDSNGIIFVTGSSWNGSYGGYVTLAYSSVGVPLWTNRYFAPDTGGGSAIAVDSDGKVFVTGTSAHGGNADYATLAYSNAGIPLWTNRYGGPANVGDDRAKAIAVDRSGNVFVTGESYNGNNFDFATIKYSNTGVPLWTNRYNGPANDLDTANAMAVDKSGNVFVTGSSPGIGTSDDYATIKYSDNGVPLWTNRYNGPANQGDSAFAIAVDNSSNVFVTGRSFGASSDYDYVTIKYSSQGIPLWTNRYNGSSNRSDTPSSIAVDSSGNVFVTGQSSDAPCCPSRTAYLTIAYSNDGVLLWQNRYDGFYSTLPHAIAGDSNGNVFVTGGAGNSTGATDIVTIKYSSSIVLPRLDFQKLNSELVLSWTNAGFNLQTAPVVTGPFTNIPAATSPFTNSFTGEQQFFRLYSRDAPAY